MQIYSSDTLVAQIEESGNNYLYVTNNGTTTLSLKNDFTGKWLVSTKLDYIEIGKIGASNLISGKYLGETVEFTYNKKNISFVYGGAKYIITAFNGTLVIEKENTLVSYVCIPENKVDAVFGTYQGVSTNGYITFDGLGSEEYGVGTACEYDGQGNTIKVYNYYLKDGVIVLQYNRQETYVFASCTDTENAYDYKGENYKIYKTDKLYLVKAYDANGVQFLFSGIGSVTCDNGDVYSYTILETNSANSTITLVLVKDGTTYDAVLDCSDYTKYTITLTARN
jgi:hypothetical protein